MLVALAATGESAQTSPTITIVHTQGLGTILAGVRGSDNSRNEKLAERLAQLRAKYGSEAVFVDGGDSIGPLVLLDTQYGLPALRLFDKNRYAAAALGIRDGLHSLGFAALLPRGAGVKTPLVGTLKTQPKGKGAAKQGVLIRPSWAVAEAKGARFQIFGVATTAGATGIAKPFPGFETLGDVEAQGRFVLDHLEPGRIPIVLSDMTPAENDRLARLLNRNALIFEGGYPWRLIHPKQRARKRIIGPVCIVSHFSPGEADVVTIPGDLKCNGATVASEVLWSPPPPPKAGALARLLGRRPLESQLVHSWFTGTYNLPDIGIKVGRRSLIKEILIPYDEKDIRRIPPPGEKDWRPPLWMERSRHLRGNETIYRYELYFQKRFMARLYRIRHVFVTNFTLIDMLVAVDKEHRLYKAHIFFPPMLDSREVRIGQLFRRLRGKKFDEITLKDWPERAGAEFIVDNVVRDLQLLLAWDEKAE